MLRGTILEGSIAPGMKVCFRQNREKYDFTIQGVEFIDRVSERQSDIGLRLSLTEVRQYKFDESEHWVGKIFECI